MFIIGLNMIRDESWKSGYTLEPSQEFYIIEFEFTPNVLGRAIDEEWYCQNRLGEYQVDKLRAILKQKFNAIKYSDGNAPVIRNRYGSRIQPMIFKTRDDAERALEWIQSIQINAKLTT